mmetsp:Transcript_45067/g.52800  ORF Transcript_45067/g.52800 Transcript_45067/m.52800 type:complete len:307 (-) Transcript_45067:176-1096(-)
MIDEFFDPFLQGIYLAPLEEQSSKMFHFVLKMFIQGSVSLPQNGIGAVADQLSEKLREVGVDIRMNRTVDKISIERSDDRFLIKTSDEKCLIRAKAVILATDKQVANKLMSGFERFKFLAELPKEAQRSVGCIYYTFEGKEPVTDPILILNGVGSTSSNNPVNNVCFPSVVNPFCAPTGYGLCCVSVRSETMKKYEGRDEHLDADVRTQLANWFPNYAEDIKKRWNLKKMYFIKNAQPVQLNGLLPANVFGGRDCRAFTSGAGSEDTISLPDGLFLCGDHMATSSLNGALESGVNAGLAAASQVAK